MHYDRELTGSFSDLLKKGGELHWLFKLVVINDELDFLIGKNHSREWISIYRGLSRILTIIKTKQNNIINIDGAVAYKKMCPGLYGKKLFSLNFQGDLIQLIKDVSSDARFNQYFNNKKEGFYQNELSRKFGICGSKNDDFVIIDKEAVIGYTNNIEKAKWFGAIRSKYKILQKALSTSNPKRYGKHLEKKALGGELDFLALHKNGNLLLIEYKHGVNTSGIYLAPIQIGMYYDLFKQLPNKDLNGVVMRVLKQKQEIGLINPDWPPPSKINELVPVLIVSEYNAKSSAKTKYSEVLRFIRQGRYEGKSFLKNVETYNYTSARGIKPW